MSRISDERIAEWRKRHEIRAGWCYFCESANCEVLEVLDALESERSRADAAERAVLVERERGERAEMERDTMIDACDREARRKCEEAYRADKAEVRILDLELALAKTTDDLGEAFADIDRQAEMIRELKERCKRAGRCTGKGRTDWRVNCPNYIHTSGATNEALARRHLANCARHGHKAHLEKRTVITTEWEVSE